MVRSAAAHRSSARAGRILGGAAALLVAVWLVVAGLGGVKVGQLAGVADNDAANFLPETSEAAVVQQEQAAFRDPDAPSVMPAIVVAARDGGVTAADQDYLAGALTSYRASVAGGSAGGPPIPPTVSKDGIAVQTVVPMATDGSVRDEVPLLREALADPPAGLDVKVTGPAGQVADLVTAFSGIDGMLLLVAGSVVALILLVVYRGPLLVLIVLFSAVSALSLAALVVYLLADAGALALSGMSQGILFILVFGAATDYALLLVSRYRQELRESADASAAMRVTWRATFGPITASASTVILGVACLLFSDLASTRDLGPVAAIGIGASWLASMTFLPAALLLTRRVAFWPLIPHPGTDHPESSGLWRRVGHLVESRSRLVWIITALALIGLAALAPGLKAHGTTSSQVFLTQVDSVAGEKLLDEHFPGGTGSPTVVVANAAAADAVLAAVSGTDGVALAYPVTGRDGAPVEAAGRVQIEAILDAQAGSAESLAMVQQIRATVHAIAGADALVGGQDALQLDTNLTSERDRTVIIPIVIIVVFAVLALLLRALLLPLLLMATVVLSYFSTLGVSAVMFNHVFGFPGADPSVPLFAFVFLVALGIDYNIFLMTRVREETVAHGTRRGVYRGLVLTGGVITSAGVVLAATFAALAVLPLLFLAQIAFLVAFGVLLDTIVVRSLLVPALTLDIGAKVWWPSRLMRVEDEVVESGVMKV